MIYSRSYSEKPPKLLLKNSEGNIKKSVYKKNQQNSYREIIEEN